ncbi:MAG: hypothetical protein GX029_00500 [Pseudomonadaceae bacterium]|nr:hypothetical protein [Pseudomonadaceae bacterium]
MGWQEGLMLLSGIIFISAVIYIVRRKRAAAGSEEDYEDPEEVARKAELVRELPSLFSDEEKTPSQQGLDPLFDEIEVFDDDPIPVLRNKQPTAESLQAAFANKLGPSQVNELSQSNEAVVDQELAWAKMRRMFAVDPAFVEASRTSIEEQQKELLEIQERKRILAQAQEAAELEEQQPEFLEEQEQELEFDDLEFEEQELEDQALQQQALEEYLAESSNEVASEHYNEDDLVELHHPSSEQAVNAIELQLEQDLDDTEQLEQPAQVAEIDPEERERDLRTALLANLEKNAWGSSEVFLTINVNAPAEQPFLGDHLAKFMDMIGMKLSETGFYHYVEEKDGQPYLGFSLVNMFSPGCFSPDMDEDFTTAGVVLVMPLPNTPLPMAVFERMLATAKVMEQSWSAELQDEQRSNLTQQTIEHYRQTIKDFEYQTRVNAKKAGRT